MPFHYLEELGTADIAFEATGHDMSELFTAAADATMNVMIENLDTIEPREARPIELENEAIDMLLFNFLQELIYFKDAERLMLRVRDVQVDEAAHRYVVRATGVGELLDPMRHEQRCDVKAVTLHRFQVERAGDGWKTTVILDI